MPTQHLRIRRAAPLLAAACLALLTHAAFGVTCRTQGAMTDAERTPIVEAARKIALDVQGSRAQELKAATVPEVASHFDGIAQSAAALAPLVSGATLTVDAVYTLDASDAKPGDEQTQFFCDSTDNTTHATFSIQQLPPGRFAFALVHATGVAKPQQLALLLEIPQPGAGWQLAGFFPKPLTVAGHDGLYYWRAARTYAQKKQTWNAWFYYSTAAYLLQPAGFFSSTNLEKLVDEQGAAPEGLPTPAAPLTVTAGSATYRITSLRTDDALGSLDLVVHYTGAADSDPITARAHTLSVMQALLTLHPELRTGFHGLWVFADANGGGQPFSLEQPMSDLAKP